MPQKFIDQTTIQPDGRPGDDAFTAFATCNDNFEDAEGRLVALEAGGQDVEDLKNGLQQEKQLRDDADTALSQAIAAEVIARQGADTALGARIVGKNVLINGSFMFWQRGTNRPEIDTGYAPRYFTADRWYIASAGTKLTMAQAAFPKGQTEVPGNPRFHLTCSSNSGLAASNLGYFGQVIEGVDVLAGEVVTLSFYARTNVAAKLGVSIVQSFGTGGNPDPEVNLVLPVQNIPGPTWQRYTLTFTMPSIAGKNMGSGHHTRIRFWMDAGSNYTNIAGAVGNQTFVIDIAQAQLERGPTATAFDERPLGLELMLCQRYYEKSYDLGISPGSQNTNGRINAFYDKQGGGSTADIRFSVRKRVPPAVSIYNDNTGQINSISAANGMSGTVQSVMNVGENGCQVNYTPATSWGASFHYTADAEI